MGNGFSVFSSPIRRADKKSQVRQCMGFSTADLCPRWPMNQLNKTQTLPHLRLPISSANKKNH